MSVFIDTNILIAYFNKDEEKHLIAKNLLERAKQGEFGAVCISDYVFDEFLNLACSRLGKNKAIELGDLLLSSSVVFEYTSSVEFKDAWVVFKQSSQLSFTDSLLVALAKRKNAVILTFDRWFLQVKDVRVISE